MIHTIRYKDGTQNNVEEDHMSFAVCNSISKRRNESKPTEIDYVEVGGNKSYFTDEMQFGK